MKASPWEKEDARHEGIPIHNFLVPKFVHARQRQADRRDVREGGAAARREGAPPARADRRARSALPVRRRAGRHRPGKCVSVDRARPRARVRRVGHAGRRHDHDGARRCPTCSSAATPRSVRRTSSGRWRTATTRRSRSISCAAARTCASARRRSSTSCRRRWASTSGATTTPSPATRRFRVPLKDTKIALASIKVEVELGFDPQARVRRSAALPQLRRADGVHRQAVHRVRRVRRHLPDGLHHVHRERRGGGACARGCRRLRSTSRRTSTCRASSRPARIMVKDEDVCLHCGLCAERCPTGAWDMQKFLLETRAGGRRCLQAARRSDREPMAAD